MTRFRSAAWAALLILMALQAGAQSQTRAAQGEHSLVRSLGGAVTLKLQMPARAAMRVSHLAGPDRVVVDIKSPRLAGMSQLQAGRIQAVRQISMGDWTRIAMVLDAPMVLKNAGYTADGHLEIRLLPASQAEFAARIDAASPTPQTPPRRPLIALDPGHGGIDPGASRGGVSEKDITLAFAHELAELLRGTGRYDVMMTRDADVFVGLGRRVEAARAAGADLFLSLHTNTVVEGDVSGSTVYVLSDQASDAASAAMAAFENSSDAYAGLDAQPGDGDIAEIIRQMNRNATGTRSEMAARLLVTHLGETIGVVRSKPLKAANFKVLRAPDMPSILLEFGFLSNQDDLARMQSPQWRSAAGNAVLTMLDLWQAADKDRLMLTDISQ